MPVRVLRPAAAEHRPRWDRHIRYLKRPPAARPSDDRRNTSIRRQTTNNRTVQNDIRRDANVRLPRTGVRDRPSGFGHGQSVVLRRQPFRLVGLQGVPARLYHAAQVRPPDGRRRPQGARLQSAPSAARPAPAAGFLFVCCSAIADSGAKAKIDTKEMAIIRFLDVVLTYHFPLCVPLSQYRHK